MNYYMTTGDVVRKLTIPRHRIIYALSIGGIPEPAKIQGRRMFTEEDLRIIRHHFKKKGVVK